MTAARLVTTSAELETLARELSREARIAIDLEANGRFAYRARVCALQIAWNDGVVIVDPLAGAAVAGLGVVLSAAGPVKIVHDVAFDARMLAEASAPLDNVHDTAVMAQLLGRSATGLASLTTSELGLALDKGMQAHDWSQRPFDDKMLAYLAADVVHLAALDDKLWGEVVTLGIDAEVQEETRYRLASAAEAVRTPDPRPPYARIKGADKLPPRELAVLRRLAEAREREAERMDVPANELVHNAAMLELARAQPRSPGDLRRVHDARPRWQPDAVTRELLRAIDEGVRDGAIPEGERGWLERPRLPAEHSKTRRARESRLLAWRKAEATRRGVNEQVILPGHCVKDLVELNEPDADGLARVPGIGAFRLERDGQAILGALLTGEAPAR